MAARSSRTTTIASAPLSARARRNTKPFPPRTHMPSACGSRFAAARPSRRSISVTTSQGRPARRPPGPRQPAEPARARGSQPREHRSLTSSSARRRPASSRGVEARVEGVPYADRLRGTALGCASLHRTCTALNGWTTSQQCTTDLRRPWRTGPSSRAARRLPRPPGDARLRRAQCRTDARRPLPLGVVRRRSPPRAIAPSSDSSASTPLRPASRTAIGIPGPRSRGVGVLRGSLSARGCAAG